MDLQITDKKSSSDSSFIIPSWYSPQELLSTVIDNNFILKKKSDSLFCKSIENENPFLTRYFMEHSDRVQQAMHEKSAQLDAYLTSLNNENILKENILNEHDADILPPNETNEQQQLYYYTNKFLPLKQRATYPIEEILSSKTKDRREIFCILFYLDARSSFPNPGPLENSSLTLFELAFNGQTKTIRDLLMQRQVYVDVCDSRGLAALHFATYNVHINVVNVLLDFGANVNQLSDDGLTPLAIAFLLYYGNDPQQTVNTALEHSDPVLLIPRPTPLVPVETRRPSTRDRVLLQSRGATNSPRNLLSRVSIIDEDKLISSIDSIKVNEEEKKRKSSIEFFP